MTRDPIEEITGIAVGALYVKEIFKMINQVVESLSYKAFAFIALLFILFFKSLEFSSKKQVPP